MCSKSTAQRLHAKSRALERYGIQLNAEKYRQLVSYITGGRREYIDGTKVNFISRQSNRVSRIEIITSEQTYIVIFDKIRKNIITFLLPEEQYQGGLA